MKKLLAILITLALATPALATTTTKIGFRNNSSATAATVTVYGMNKMRNQSGTYAQVFSPDPALSRTYSLGTKGMANYSTNNAMVIKFTAVETGTTTPINVKVFMNDIETHVLTTSGETLGVNQ